MYLKQTNPQWIQPTDCRILVWRIWQSWRWQVVGSMPSLACSGVPVGWFLSHASAPRLCGCDCALCKHKWIELNWNAEGKFLIVWDLNFAMKFSFSFHPCVLCPNYLTRYLTRTRNNSQFPRWQRTLRNCHSRSLSLTHTSTNRLESKTLTQTFLQMGGSTILNFTRWLKLPSVATSCTGAQTLKGYRLLSIAAVFFLT